MWCPAQAAMEHNWNQSEKVSWELLQEPEDHNSNSNMQLLPGSSQWAQHSHPEQQQRERQQSQPGQNCHASLSNTAGKGLAFTLAVMLTLITSKI